VFSAEEIASLRGTPDVKESFESGNGNDTEQPNIWLPDELLPGFRDAQRDFFNVSIYCTTSPIPATLFLLSFTLNMFFAQTLTQKWTIFWIQLNLQVCTTLTHQLLTALSLALPSVPESYLSDSHSSSLFQLRLLHYPAASRRILSSAQATRIGAHSDFGTITLLWQDQVGGLEILKPRVESQIKPDGHARAAPNRQSDENPENGTESLFIPVDPLPGAVLVNVGDLMERWSNGRWRSVVHRVGAPPLADTRSSDGLGGRVLADLGEQVELEGDAICSPRYSIPFFATANSDAVIDALPGCWELGVPKRYDSVTARDYVRMRMKALY
jgi:2OG-Fe(II) oxygenase superfamily